MNKPSGDKATLKSEVTEHGDGEIRKFFDDMSSGRNETINANPVINYEQLLRGRTVLDLLEVKPGERILDIGCGNARDIIFIVQMGAQVVGVDISEGMVKAAQEEVKSKSIKGVTLQVGDATALDFSDAYFDKVLCSEVVEHIPNAAKAFSEMRRVLKTGGRLVISTPNKVSWYGWERYWLWEKILRRKWPHPCDEWRSMAEVVNLIENSGLKVLRKKTVCFIPGFIVTYFVLPRMLQSLVVRLVGAVEPFLRRLAPNRGYTVCVSSVRDE